MPLFLLSRYIRILFLEFSRYCILLEVNRLKDRRPRSWPQYTNTHKLKIH